MDYTCFELPKQPKDPHSKTCRSVDRIAGCGNPSVKLDGFLQLICADRTYNKFFLLKNLNSWGTLSGYPLLVLAAGWCLHYTAHKYPSNLHTPFTYAYRGCGLFAAIRGAGVPHITSSLTTTFIYEPDRWLYDGLKTLCSISTPSSTKTSQTYTRKI
jgi:hypothetical protein